MIATGDPDRPGLPRPRARELLGDQAAAAGFDQRLSVALSAIRGLALVRTFEPVEHERADPWPYHRDALERLLADAGGAP